jgi:hypothetical protein
VAVKGDELYRLGERISATDGEEPEESDGEW